MLMGSIMKFVLYCSKEFPCKISIGIIIYTCDKNVCHLLIQIALAASDITDALQQFPKVAITITFQAIVIKYKAFLNKFKQMIRSPLTEASCHLRLYSIAHCDNHFQVIVAYLSSNTSTTFLSN